MEPEAPFYRKSHRDGYVRHRGLRRALLDDRLRGVMSTMLVREMVDAEEADAEHAHQFELRRLRGGD